MSKDANPFTKKRGWAPRELIALILDLGYEMNHARGSHKKFVHPETQHSFCISVKGNKNMCRFDAKLVKTLRNVWNMQHGFPIETPDHTMNENSGPLAFAACGELVSKRPYAMPITITKIDRIPNAVTTPVDFTHPWRVPDLQTPVESEVDTEEFTMTKSIPAIGNKKWNEWIRTVREAAPLSLRASADLMEWSSYTLAAVENGDRLFSKEEFERWCDIFDVKNPPTIPLETDEAVLAKRRTMLESSHKRFPRHGSEVKPPKVFIGIDVGFKEPTAAAVLVEVPTSAAAKEPKGVIARAAADYMSEKPAGSNIVAEALAEYKELGEALKQLKTMETRYHDLEIFFKTLVRLFPGLLERNDSALAEKIKRHMADSEEEA